MSFRSYFLPTIVCVALAGAGGCQNKAKPGAKKESGPVEVKTAVAATRTVQRTVEGVGTLFPFDEAVISAEVDGRLEQVQADLGDAVAKDQVLARISDEEQRYLVMQQEAQLRQSLERLGLKDEKDKVKDVKQTPDARRAQAELFDAETRLRRTRELTEQGIGPKSDLDQAQARWQAAQATFEQTLNQTRNLIQEVERFKASLELQRKKLRDTHVRAPFQGLVKDRQAVAGAFVRANTAMFTLVKIDPIRLRMEVPERMAPWVRVGQMTDVQIEAYGDRKFQGRVSRISPTVDQTKRTFVVEALIENSKGELKPGSYARAHLPTEKRETITVVPARAINYVLGTNKAYVVRADSTIEIRDVNPGERFPEEIEVMAGVKEGETVATSGLTRLDTGTKVKVAAGK